MSKLLSICITIRNDQYYKDLIFRCQRALDMNLYNFNKTKLKDLIEILYIDWGSEKKISETLHVHKKFRDNVKFIYVDKNISKKNSKGYAGSFNVDKSINVGIRRARGKFRLQMGLDQFFDVQSIEHLINFLKKTSPNEKSIYYIPRKILDKNLYFRNPDNKFYNNFLNIINSTNFRFKPHTFYDGGGFATLFSKSNDFKFTSYNEKMIPGTGSDTELLMRINLAGYNQINLDTYGIRIFKFPPLTNSFRQILIHKKAYRKYPEVPKKIAINDKYWGLGKSNLKLKSSNKLVSSFDNYKKFEGQLIENKEKVYLSKYRVYLILKQLDLNVLRDSKNIFYLINLIDNHKVNSLIEFGFNNSSRLSILGTIFNYLNIVTFDYEQKNFPFGYKLRLKKIIDVLNLNRYGKFSPFISKNNSIFINRIKSTLKNDKASLLLINNKIDKNVSSLIKNIKLNQKLYEKFKFIMILDFANKQKINNYFKKFICIKLSDNNFIFINKKNYKFSDINKFDKYPSNLSNIFPFCLYFIHRVISKFLSIVRSNLYSLLKQIN